MNSQTVSTKDIMEPRKLTIEELKERERRETRKRSNAKYYRSHHISSKDLASFEAFQKKIKSLPIGSKFFQVTRDTEEHSY